LLSKIQKAKQRPSNQDILSAARSACCRLSLETSIEAKFGVLPRRIYLKAAKLCGEHGVQVQWHLKGYICSNGFVLESMESLLAHIGLYASTDIAAGEEITRDYERKPVTSGQENEHSCHCRATNCRNHFC
ncbi:unnamed protein product, partial [Brassica oleracea]